MKLSADEVDLFYRLYHSLFMYVNKKTKTIRGISSLEDLRKQPMEKIMKLRDRLYKHPEMIDSFVSENPLDYSDSDLKIIGSWKNFVKGDFLVVRHLRNYTVFLSIGEKPLKAYGVLGLVDPLEELIGPYLPVMVETVLLPFNDKITYDSIISSYSISFGGEMRRSFNDAYQEAKMRFGIITSLPFEAQEAEQSDSDRLRFYLKNKRNRDRYWKEIEELTRKSPELLALYHQEMGKIHARTYRNQMRKIGIGNGWFAILEGIMIAGAPTKEGLEKDLQGILPPEKREFVYIFQLKGK